MNLNYSNLDHSIIATADDAITAKKATVNTGYYDDPFLEVFATPTSSTTTPTSICTSNPANTRGIIRRPRSSQRAAHPRQVQPIIKRGTHARVCVMDRAISTFLNNNSQEPTCQIIVLGAGMDTSYFRYCTNNIMGQQESSTTEVNWYEIDHSIVIEEKAGIIKHSSTILSSISSQSQRPQLEPTKFGYQLSSDKNNSSLSLVGHDLRASPEDLFTTKLNNLDSSLPTLVLIECVFMYLPSKSTKILLKTISSRLKNAYVVAYEPILGVPNPMRNPFGKMMEQNLRKHGVITQGEDGDDDESNCCILSERTLNDQLYKFVEFGQYDIAVGCDMSLAYETILTKEQRTRANSSEFLDELEEWLLIMRHYCFVVAKVGFNDDDDNGNKETISCLTYVAPRGSSSLSTTADTPSISLGFISGKCEVVKKK